MGVLFRAPIVLAICAVAAGPAGAQALDGDALRALTAAGEWRSDHAEYGTWIWSGDGTVCLRVVEGSDDCTDQGSWAISDNVLCYELTWLWESVGERATCFTVAPLADGRFETVFHGGAMVSRMFAFDVVP